MSKRLKIALIIIAVILVGVTFTACVQEGGSTKTLQLLNPDEVFSFTQGEVNLSKIKFNVFNAEGEIVETLAAEASMFNESDLVGLANLGTRVITLHYDGMSMPIQITITQKLVAAEYTLTLDANGGYFEADNSITYIIKSKDLANNTVNSFPLVKKDGYVFDGWQDENGAKQGTPYVVSHNHTLFAKWEFKDRCIVRFISPYQDDMEFNIAYGSDLKAPAAVEVVGYTFKGWQIGSSPTLYKAGEDIPNITDDISISAIYEPIIITIRFTSIYWEDIIKTVVYGSNFDIDEFIYEYSLEDAVDGYDLNGFVIATTNTPANFVNIRANVNLEAKYTKKVFSVRFYKSYPATQDGLVQTISVNWNETIHNPPAVPIYDDEYGGQSHQGRWMYIYQGNLAAANVVLTSPILNNIDIFAEYSPVICTITFNYHDLINPGGNLVQQTVNLAYGSIITPPALSNYDRKYWTITWHHDQSYSQDQLLQPTDKVTETSKTIFGLVKENPFIVDFYIPQNDVDGNDIVELNNGTIASGFLESKSVVKGNNVTPPVKIDDKYEIIGWSDYFGNQITNFTITDFKEGQDGFYAIVRIRSYPVTYYKMVVSGSINNPTTTFEIMGTYTTSCRYGMAVTSSPIADTSLYRPQYDDAAGNFVFNGWYTTPEFNLKRVDFTQGYTVTGNTSFYMCWLDNDMGTPGLTFELNDDTVTYKVVGFVESMALNDIIIPKTYNGLPVTKIAKGAFAETYVSVFETIKLNSNINLIEEGAFSGVKVERFEMLETSSYFSIDGQGVLYDKINNILIAYPVSATADSYVVDASTLRIGDAAFATTINLKYVTLAEGLTEIGQRAFYFGGLREISLPDSLLKIEDEAFLGCGWLTLVTCGQNGALSDVSYKAFELTPWYDNETDQLILGAVLLRYKGNEANLVVNKNVKIVATNAFTPIIGQALSTIEFSSDSEIETIQKNAFLGMSLNAVYILVLRDININVKAFQGIINSTPKLYVPNSKIDYYKGLNLEMVNPNNITANN